MLGDTNTYAYEGGYARFYIVPEEGTYYIQNVGSGRYVDVEGPSLNDGAAIHEWDFRTNPQEKWIVEHVENSDGYIRLKSVYSNKYIGIDSEALSYVKQYAAQNNYTLWRIDRTSSGNLTFQCKVYQGTDAVMAVPTASTSNGTNLIMAAYTDNATYTDEWYLLEKVISYVNYYDSSFAGNSLMIQNITTANEFSNMVYSKYFNIGMGMDGSASQYATVIDSCSTGTNSPCTSEQCGSDCNATHHKNGLVISNQIYYEDREADHVYILWTNRAYGTYCNESTDSHSDVKWIAVVYGKRPVIHFMTIGGNESVQLACMTLNIVHETAHTLNMDDVYNNENHNAPNATVCVMEKFDNQTAYDFYIDVLNGEADPFCDSCRIQLQAYIDNISIPGN